MRIKGMNVLGHSPAALSAVRQQKVPKVQSGLKSVKLWIFKHNFELANFVESVAERPDS